MTARRFASLALFLLVSLGGGLAIGFASRPGEWYAALNKPVFNPPDWVFGPVWTVLFVLIGVAGWRVLERNLRPPFGWWLLQMALNFAWTPLFFVGHRIGGALAVVLALLFAVLAFVGSAWNRDRPAAWLFVPYAAWVGFAAVLTASIWWMN